MNQMHKHRRNFTMISKQYDLAKGIKVRKCHDFSFFDYFPPGILILSLQMFGSVV